jgi:DNA-binding NarL/FixJ family response regulator
MPTPPADTPPFTVLIVDDSEHQRYLLRLVAERHGAVVVDEAADGRTGIELAGRHRPDLIVLDLAMPVMNGIEALPSLRQVAPESRVVVLSHFSSARMARHTAALGAVGYVEKSTPQDRLFREILLAAGLLDVVVDAVRQAMTTFAPEPQNAGSARRFVDEILRQWDCEELVENVTLLVSELVTNAIEHARSDLDVAVKLFPDRVRVDVLDRIALTDANGVAAATGTQAASAEATSGRGLFMVEAIAQRWGVDESDDGKSVWFELAR